MITLGVDLASDPRATAWCRVAWHPGRAVVEGLVLGATDDDLLAAHTAADVTDRSGDGRVFEVYPAAALHRWGLRSTGYKQPRATPQRAKLVHDILLEAPWLDASAHLTLLGASADALDALVAALVTRAAALGLTSRPDPHDHPRAAREGWIALPPAGSLESLSARSR